jgi:very-short-patch-repair endonuclease
MKLAIEVDGPEHQRPRQRLIDQRKARALRRLGWSVFRISEDVARVFR